VETGLVEKMQRRVVGVGTPENNDKTRASTKWKINPPREQDKETEITNEWLVISGGGGRCRKNAASQQVEYRPVNRQKVKSTQKALKKKNHRCSMDEKKKKREKERKPALKKNTQGKNRMGEKKKKKKTQTFFSEGGMCTQTSATSRGEAGT